MQELVDMVNMDKGNKDKAIVDKVDMEEAVGVDIVNLVQAIEVINVIYFRIAPRAGRNLLVSTC